MGLNLSYSKNKSTSSQFPDYTYEGNYYGAGVFYRRYLSLSRSFYLFGEAGAGYSQGNSKEQNAAYFRKEKNKSFSLGLYPGVTYAVNKRFHLEASLNNLVSLNYNSNTITTTPTGGSTQKLDSRGFGFSTNFNSATPLTIGFRIVIGK
jgi:outer membrane receptor for ferrienterochelin and colicin